jgi:hypothetical protein
MRNGDHLLLADPEPRESRRTKLARRFTVAAAFLLMMTVLVAVLYTVTLMRETQLDNKKSVESGAASAASAAQAAKAAERTADRIEDCTSPDGDCYQRGQDAQAEAVGSINKVVILAAACAEGLDPDLSVADRRALVEDCVIEGLADEKP